MVFPEETLRRLLVSAGNVRRKRSLEAINEACRILTERGAVELSYKAIVTLGEDRGLPVPSEKSIVNPSGEHYRELVQAWRLTMPEKQAKHPGSTNWISEIEDPVLRMSVALLAKELAAYKAKEARKAKYSGAPIFLGSAQQRSASQLMKLNEAEVAALKSAIDPLNLSLVGLSVGDRGEIFDSKGRKIHKPGFRDAVEKILAVHSIEI